MEQRGVFYFLLQQSYYPVFLCYLYFEATDSLKKISPEDPDSTESDQNQQSQ